jgi:tRNA A-37 threonylcarbamoyl transferase component Bud32
VSALPDTPPGYTPFLDSGALVVALASCADTVRQAVKEGSLYAYAANHPARRALRGRGTAYAVPLPDRRTRVVVRHSRHGGFLAGLTGDRFLFPTRAPRELRTAVRLADADVATPQVIAYATYPAGGFIVRCDVATREVEGGVDLGELLARRLPPDDLQSVLVAVAELLRALQRVGARHPDLNVANVLIVPTGNGSHRAYVVDVDRVEFGKPEDSAVGAANLQRLLRSARKQRARGTIEVTDADLETLARLVGGST